jgi:hypothetical protein
MEVNARTKRHLIEQAREITQLLDQHIPHTRQILRKLIPDEVVAGKRIPGRIVCTPINDARGQGYEFLARGSYSQLLGAGVAINDGGGGHPLLPSLTQLFLFELRGIVLVV